VVEREFVTHSPEETISLGRQIAADLNSPTLVLLSGDLGAGKTTLTKGIASGLRAAREEDVTSPTFTLVHKYDGEKCVYHVDLYRIGDAHDFETLGLEDVLAENAIVLIEWPERMTLRTEWPIVRIKLEHVDESTRRVVVEQKATATRARPSG
jgi:tRNA threonylcarbamoyladenosine biosynthesis protein TsaE